ncbi:hypothetical protein Tco_1414877 [Tanacetum coccineum]
MSKYSPSNSPVSVFSSTLGSSSRESSFFLIISINIMSLSSLFMQTNSTSDDWGTKPSDSKNELTWRTFPVMNETDGSGGEEGLVLMFSWLSVSSHSSSVGLLFWDSSGYLRHIVTTLIELWIQVEH